jgi:uncharacterized protein YcfL
LENEITRMSKLLFALAAASLLAGCCSCPQPCPYLVNNPDGECPCGALIGCKCVPTHEPQVNTYSTGNPVANINHESYDRVVLDGFQANMVAVQDIRRSRTNDGYERIQVFVKNLTTVAVRTRYRFDWQDVNGVVIEDPDHDAWEKMTLIPGDDGVFTSIAPQKDCADFRMRMALIR